MECKSRMVCIKQIVAYVLGYGLLLESNASIHLYIIVMINNHVHTRTHTPLCACANVCDQLGASRYSNIVA